VYLVERVPRFLSFFLFFPPPAFFPPFFRSSRHPTWSSTRRFRPWIPLLCFFCVCDTRRMFPLPSSPLFPPPDRISSRAEEGNQPVRSYIFLFFFLFFFFFLFPSFLIFARRFFSPPRQDVRPTTLSALSLLASITEAPSPFLSVLPSPSSHGRPLRSLLARFISRAFPTRPPDGTFSLGTPPFSQKVRERLFPSLFKHFFLSSPFLS